MIKLIVVQDRSIKMAKHSQDGATVDRDSHTEYNSFAFILLAIFNRYRHIYIYLSCIYIYTYVIHIYIAIYWGVCPRIERREENRRRMDTMWRRYMRVQVNEKNGENAREIEGSKSTRAHGVWRNRFHACEIDDRIKSSNYPV